MSTFPNMTVIEREKKREKEIFTSLETDGSLPPPFRGQNMEVDNSEGCIL